MLKKSLNNYLFSYLPRIFRCNDPTRLLLASAIDVPARLIIRPQLLVYVVPGQILIEEPVRRLSQGVQCASGDRVLC